MGQPVAGHGDDVVRVLMTLFHRCVESARTEHTIMKYRCNNSIAILIGGKFRDFISSVVVAFIDRDDVRLFFGESARVYACVWRGGVLAYDQYYYNIMLYYYL